ncbi:ribulose-phosphate 3-epimerase, cytoplasmic isoform [Capsicum annuum]|uniref:ribulose-phosphate 3-epimerase, cytoplasmic isoform n=1 Tax=Capsicum annuum TaxID=4072 RepID=UPI001FB0D611|nr:ribulose-phosphate 3-epimerase, cytoplasmic isoform [Capsicum annuum]
MVKAIIAPSMLSSDFGNLASEAERMLNCGADWLHMDIMKFKQMTKELHRGHHPISLGSVNLMAYMKLSKGGVESTYVIDGSLMALDAINNWQELVQRIKSKGMKPGVSLKPGTPIEEVYPLLDGENSVELVLVMTVEPGFGGQKFMPEMMDKVRTLRKKYPSLDIEVDGGLGPSTIEAASSAGANCIVAGSSVFGAPDPAQVITLMRGSVEKRS